MLGTWLLLTVVCLLPGGATGKSAQIPLFVWLPDAMRARRRSPLLIHAATMVTRRLHGDPLHFRPRADRAFADRVDRRADWRPAATIAVTQQDIKKVLAHSIGPQLGYVLGPALARRRRCSTS
jgi:NADH-quinone oxidoreductase subunit L